MVARHSKIGIDLNRWIAKNVKKSEGNRDNSNSHAHTIKNLNEFIYERINSEWSAKKYLSLLCESENRNLWHRWMRIPSTDMEHFIWFPLRYSHSHRTVTATFGASFFRFHQLRWLPFNRSFIYIMLFYQYLFLFSSHWLPPIYFLPPF